MRVFLCLLNGMFYRMNFLANRMRVCVCVCVCIHYIYMYIYIYNYIYVGSEMAQLCLTLCDPMFCSLPGSSILWIFLARVTGEDCHFLLQGIFPTQGLNPHLPHCRQMLYRLSHQGSLSIYVCMYICIVSVQFSHSVMSDSLQPRGLQHARPLSITNSQSLLNSCPLSL